MFCFILNSHKNNNWLPKIRGMSWVDVKEELNNISLQDPMLIEWIWQTAIDSRKLLQPMFNFNIM